MVELLLAAGLIFASSFLIEHPLLFAAWALLLVPGIYAMITGAPFVPTSQSILKTMMDLAAIRPGERVVDLGCGDGRLVRAAAAQGATATGYELSPFVYVFASMRTFLHRNARIRFRDFWGQDLSDTDVIFCYLLTDTMQTFKKALWPTLRPGTRVVSHAFAMEGIEPVKQVGNVRLYVK